MKFRDRDHENFFYHLFDISGAPNDGYHRGLFYMLSLLDDMRRNIKDLYNAEDDTIIHEGLNKPWQTGGSSLATMLAFNLYNGYSGREGDEYLYTPYNLLNSSLMEYGLEACRLRFRYMPVFEPSVTYEEESEELEW